jgi:hypothetical protein
MTKAFPCPPGITRYVCEKSFGETDKCNATFSCCLVDFCKSIYDSQNFVMDYQFRLKKNLASRQFEIVRTPCEIIETFANCRVIYKSPRTRAASCFPERLRRR